MFQNRYFALEKLLCLPHRTFTYRLPQINTSFYQFAQPSNLRIHHPQILHGSHMDITNTDCYLYYFYTHVTGWPTWFYCHIWLARSTNWLVTNSEHISVACNKQARKQWSHVIESADWKVVSGWCCNRTTCCEINFELVKYDTSFCNKGETLVCYWWWSRYTYNTIRQTKQDT